MTRHRQLRSTLERDPDELVERFLHLGTRSDVADLLEVSDSDLIYILYRAPGRYPYREFTIRKKGGGEREIAAPANSLKILQQKLAHVLSLVYKPKTTVHGFGEKRSILTNARQHSGKRYVLNIDLRDFFPSINFGRVRGVFIAAPYRVGEGAATVLAQICCHANQLPQGAPTSPIISNMVCTRLDGQLSRLARKNRCVYSRYADDISFSTDESDFPSQLASQDGGWDSASLTIGDELEEVIRSNDFEINGKKQRLQYRSQHQDVTGLTVNKEPNVRRRYVRQIRAMLHAWEKYGLEASEEEFHNKFGRSDRNPEHAPPSFGRVVRGKLDFLKMVKGESDPVFRRLANKLHELDPDLMPHYAEPPDDRDDRWSYWTNYYRDAVYQLVVKDERGESSGTAFAWRRTHLATTAHDLAGDISICPPCPDGVTFSKNDFHFHPSEDPAIDAALVRLPPGADVFTHDFRVRESTLAPGEPVAALAYPAVPLHEPEIGIYLGFVESTMPYFGAQVESIQVTIEMSGGMSGAPVIDRDGRLVGVVRGQPFLEKTDDGVPRRDFKDIVPVKYLVEILDQA